MLLVVRGLVFSDGLYDLGWLMRKQDVDLLTNRFKAILLRVILVSQRRKNAGKAKFHFWSSIADSCKISIAESKSEFDDSARHIAPSKGYSEADGSDTR